MTFGQRRILNWLDGGPLTVTDLEDYLMHTGQTHSAIHHSLRRMEDSGWVRGFRDSGNLGTSWELTAAGRKAREL